MEHCSFRGRSYVKVKQQLFVFEPTWDSFRPIEKVAWNGMILEIVDEQYKDDLLSDQYGFGSLEMRALCKKLTQVIELESAKEIVDPAVFWRWCGHQAEWWRDRPCLFKNEVIARDVSGWKRYVMYLQSKQKTLKQRRRACLTRRLLLKRS